MLKGVAGVLDREKRGSFTVVLKHCLGRFGQTTRALDQGRRNMAQDAWRSLRDEAVDLNWFQYILWVAEDEATLDGKVFRNLRCNADFFSSEFSSPTLQSWHHIIRFFWDFWAQILARFKV